MLICPQRTKLSPCYVAVVVLDGEELPISICLTQHRLAHQLGNSLLLQEEPVLDPLMLAGVHVS